MTVPAAVSPLRLDGSRVPEQAVEALFTGCGAAEPDAAVIDVEGPGAIDCLQGLVSSDLDGRGERGFLYGAVLTRFGMILSDLWVARRAGGARLVVPGAGAGALGEVLRKSLPPRLARATERADVTVLRLVGPRAAAVIQAIGFDPPEPGTSASPPDDDGTPDIAHAPPGAPFTIQMVAPTPMPIRERLRLSGVVEGGRDLLELARVVAGWPALGHEIDSKTLPQEVRYDDIGGVSYTKGCFVGQETVARVHFRGHPNRGLRGLLFEREPRADAEVTVERRDAGRVTAQAWLGRRRRWIGLAMLRREVELGAAVLASSVTATVVPLPFAPEMV